MAPFVGRGPLWLAAFALSGCLAAAPVPPAVAISMGRPTNGILRAAERLPSQGRGFVFVREPAAAHGASSLVGLLKRSAARLRAEAAGPPLRIGDLSLATGGRIPGHASHRTGRDADVLFPMADSLARPVDGIGGMPIPLSGFGTAGGTLYRIDVRRTWTFVRALLTDRESSIQWLFVSRGVKALLLEHALRAREDPGLVERASFVMHQPRRGRPHDDHVHIRVYCAPVDRAYGCIDDPPIWPWRKKESDAGGSTDATDRALLTALFEGMRPAPDQLSSRRR